MSAGREQSKGEGWDQVEWESYIWDPEVQRQMRGPRGARVATFARRMVMMERARAQRSEPADFLARIRGKRLGFGRVDCRSVIEQG